jgi:hypothetical protein
MLLSYFLILILFPLKDCDIDFRNLLNSNPDNNSNSIGLSYLLNIKDSLINMLDDTIIKALNNIINQTNITGTKEDLEELEMCKDKLKVLNSDGENEENYLMRKYWTYLTYYESSKGKSDLGKYIDCLESQNFESEEINISLEQKKKVREATTFIVFKVIEKNDKSIFNFTYKANEYLFGLCVVKGCSEKALKNLFLEVNKILTFFDNLDNDNLDLFDLKGERENNKYWLIPLIILLLIMFLNLSKFLLRCLHVNNKNKIVEFINCFDFNNNYKEILGKDQTDDSSNLNLIKGIRGITLMSIVINVAFFYIYHLPTKVINEISLLSLFKSYSFPLIYHGERFAKKILYALSGFELACKMFHYLDNALKNRYDISKNEVDENMKKNENFNLDDNDNYGEELEHEDNINNSKINLNEMNNNSKILENNSESINDQQEEENEDEEEEDKNYLKKNYMKFIPKRTESLLRDEEKEKINDRTQSKDMLCTKTNQINFGEFENDFSLSSVGGNYYKENRLNIVNKVLINWFIKILYKYILFIIIIILYKYGTIYSFMSYDNVSPIWILYFKGISDKFSILHIIANIFCFSPYSYKTYNWIDPFELVYNEITFFIIGSLLIFFCYKYCLKLDIFILISSIILFALKIILGIFVLLNNDYYPSMFYQYDGSKDFKIRRYISSNPFMNLHIFLLGMFFGELHYCIYYEESVDKNKKYLKLAQKLVGCFKKIFLNQSILQSIIIHIFLLLLFGSYIVLVYIQEIMINHVLENENIDYNFFADKIFNIVALFDSDVAVIIFLFIIIILIFHRDSIISHFIEHKYWRILAMPYWSNLLFLHICASYIFYFCESKIKLVVFIVIFVSFQIIILLILVSCISFVLIELPLKKMTNKFFKLQIK